MDEEKGVLADIWTWMKNLVPTAFKPGKPHFNFLTIHYMYLIGLTIVGSILLYPAGVVHYTDALFFAAGTATQSGLNTININEFHTYQQVVLYFIACVANPVFINTVVVFIRLHWFEKRFQSIVADSHRTRRTRTRSRTVSQARVDQDPSRLEAGVNGRTIQVLHTQFNGMTSPGDDGKINGLSEKEQKQHLAGSFPDSDRRGSVEDSGSSDSTAVPAAQHFFGQNPALRREITFADELDGPESPPVERDESPLPSGPRDEERHIAFLEKQRKKDQGTLRIPGPRDFDRGDVPRELDSDEEDNELDHVNTADDAQNNQAPPESKADATEKMNEDDHPPKRGLEFDEPSRPDRGVTTATHPKSTRFNPFHPLSGIRHRQPAININHHTTNGLRTRATTFSFSKSQERDMPYAIPYLSWQPTIGRNSQFPDLTEEQREELGGIEYRSLKTLALILVCYFFGFHLLGVVVLLPWIVLTDTWGSVLDSDGQSRVWWGIFTPASMFNDLGFTLTPDSMISFQTAVLPLLLGSFLIIIGNTGFPCMLRFVIWCLSKMVPVGSGIWEELRFLLDHPRRCFTLLFPSKATWWLFWILVLLNGIDLLFFIILDLNDEVVTSLAPGYRVLNGWFQATSTRTAGFACVNLANLHPAIQVSYLIMMYISVFPIAISVRRTNVYEEKSLGIWGGEEEDDEEGTSYVGQHLRRQLSFDLWYIFLGLFIIAIVEGGRLQNTNEYAFTLFSVLFEIVSAYGTVGLSLGYPTIDASFSAEFKVLSKLIIIAMMIRGRHRGLPYALDRAILLPSESLHKKEAEDAARRAARRNSMSLRTNTVDHRTDSDAHSPVSRRNHFRRGSDMSARSKGGAQQRRLSTILMSGLSAGPTYAKNE